VTSCNYGDNEFQKFLVEKKTNLFARKQLQEKKGLKSNPHSQLDLERFVTSSGRMGNFFSCYNFSIVIIVIIIIIALVFSFTESFLKG